MTLAFPTPSQADAPQLTVAAAHYHINNYAYNNPGYGSWACDAQSDLAHGPGCYSDYPASISIGYGPRVAQNPFTGTTVSWITGAARDGGFIDPQKFDTPSALEAVGPQGGQHLLREARFELDGNPQPADHTIIYSNHYNLNTNSFIGTVGVFDSGAFPNNTMSGAALVESFSGYDGFQWSDLFRAHRPGGQGTGAEYHFNKFALVPDPNDPFRLIGMVRANNAGVQNVLTPVFVDWNAQTVGFHFTNEGWQEYPWGTDFTDFDMSATFNPNSGVIPDTFVGLTGGSWIFGFANTALIDGKIILLRRINAPQGPYEEGDATCPPEQFGYDHDLYAQRTRDPNYPWNGAFRFQVREADTVNWAAWAPNTFQWVGSTKTILDGNQPSSLRINPTDSKAIGGYLPELMQMPNGTVYMYSSVKRTLCEGTAPFQAFDRFPTYTSGSSPAWFRLSY